MATSSSAKKVARVAAKSATGSKATKQSNWMFPVAIALLVVLGIGVVVFARSENGGTADNTTPPRAQLTDSTPSDHWHAAFAINVCGKELAAPKDVQEDAMGIHTHGDGLAHIHPFVLAAAGKRATMQKFFDQIGLVVTDDGFKTADGKVYKAGETTCEGKPTELVMAHWKDAATSANNEPDKIITEHFGKVQFSENLGGYTLALVPKGQGDDIPAPSAGANIEQLGAADGGSTTGTAADQGTETPAPTAGSDSGSPSTTAAQP